MLCTNVSLRKEENKCGFDRSIHFPWKYFESSVAERDDENEMARNGLETR